MLLPTHNDYVYIILQVLTTSFFNCEGPNTQATLGLHKLKLDPGEADEFYHLEHIPIEKYEVHPRWDSARPLAYDFVVLKLKWASQLYADQIVGLDSPNDGFALNVGDQVVTMGFGQYKTELPYFPNALQEVTLHYVLNEQCSPGFGYELYTPEEIICTTGAPGGENGLCHVRLCLLLLHLVFDRFEPEISPSQYKGRLWWALNLQGFKETSWCC